MLENISTRAPKEFDKEETKLRTQENIDKITLLQRKLFAQQKYSLLIVLQGMDAAGKNGAARKVFSGINPAGISVTSFKKPTEEEYAHDFLWRVHQHTPAKGMIKLFNRSHYEDILVPTVLNLFPKDEIEERYELINHFEKILKHNNTKILKFYLHVSKEEQLERLQERIDHEEKHWKHNDEDWKTRERWEDYINVYESIFKKCDQPKWEIIPSDQNWYKEYLISKKVLNTLENLNLKWPNLETEIFNAQNEKK